jgi:hypothetical protein
MSSRRIDVTEAIGVHIVTNEEHLSWVHSHGMDKFGLPELEMRDVPVVFSVSAGIIINTVADYMLNEEHIKLGEIFSRGHELIYFMRLDPLKGNEDHYSCDRWAMVHPSVAVEELSGSVVYCDECRNKIMAFLLADDGYEAGSSNLNEHLDRLVHFGTVIRMPRAKGQKEAMFIPSARGVAVYEREKGPVQCDEG